MSILQHLVIARIPEHIEPIDRGERYEDPLTNVLEARGLGQVTGGGSQLDENFRIAFVDLEIQIANLEQGLPLVVSSLTEFGAPKGSKLLFERDGVQQELAFGSLELAEVFLDGVNLPPEVYEELDFEAFHKSLRNSLLTGGIGEPRGVWSGETETAVFIFAPVAKNVPPVLAGLVQAHPILRNARVVLRASGDGKPIDEVHLPSA